MNGCEPDEVLIKTLREGATFELRLVTKVVRGIVIQQLAGSTLVDVGDRQHLSRETPVIPGPEVAPSDWIVKEKRMPRAKAEKKEKTPKAEERFVLSSRGSKTLLDPENDSRAALVYQALAKHGPVTLDALFDLVKKDFVRDFRGKPEHIKGNVRTFLRNFRKQGLVKTAEPAKSAKAQAVAAA